MARSPRSLFLSAAASLALLAGPAGAADQTITTGTTFFNSPNRTINAGDKVTWTNTAHGIHNVVSGDAGFRCANGCDGEGGNGTPSSAEWSFTRTFNTAGTFDYHCEVHGGDGTGMHGVITVQGTGGGGGGGGTPGTLRFSASNYNVNEGGGNVTLTFQRTAGDDGAVSVHYATSNGSATAGSDYTAKSGTVSWADNDDTNKTVAVAITNDTAQESSESFTVTLSAPGGGATLASPSVATVTIADNDGGGGGGGTPAAPSNLKASALSKTQVQLNWTDHASNETGFVVEMQTGTDGGAFSQVGTAGANATGVTIGGLSQATFYTFRVRATNGSGASANSNLASATTDTDAAACADDDDTLCLNGDRFRVEVSWATSAPASGIGHRVELTSDTGYFWFFTSTNVEMVIKVLNACGLNSRYWVFAGGLTNVKAVITVTDSQTGKVTTYVNPINTNFQPIQDTSAFATCP